MPGVVGPIGAGYGDCDLENTMLLPVVIITWAAAVSSTQETRPAASGEATSRPAVVAVEPVHDFGRVKQQSVLRHTFSLKNVSEQAIEIKGVTSSCSCTSAILSTKHIPPSGSGAVEIVFDTGNLYGQIQKPALVRFEDPHVLPVRLAIAASVFVPAARLDVLALNFDEVPVGTSPSRTIRVVNFADPDWKMVGLRVSSPLISAEYVPNRAEILCRISERSPIGPIDAKVILDTEESGKPSAIEVPVRAQITGPVQLEPGRVFVGVVDPNSTVAAHFALRSRDSAVRPEVASTSGGCTVIAEGSAGDQYGFRLQITAPERPGFFEGEVYIRTGLGVQPLVQLRYAGLVTK